MVTQLVTQLDVMKSKLDRPALKNLEGKENLVGVEIGVLYGVNARDILEKYDIKMLYLIDPYIEYRNMKNKKVPPEGKEEAKEYLKEFNDRIKWIYKFSINAVDLIPNDLDFVYIDGDHRYEAVKMDLELYYPKVKKGGLFSGHDYAKRAPSVMKAVDEFFSNKNEKFYHAGKWDWWVIKGVQ